MTITVNGIPVESFNFSGGEVQVKVSTLKINKDPICILKAFITSSDDIMKLLLTTDALRRAGWKNIGLVLPYLPYARQDRVCAPGEALSLKVFCDLINGQNYTFVQVWDVHSDVSLALLNNVQNIEQSTFLSRVVFEVASPILVAPDAGALKKTEKVAKLLRATYIRADKTRDPATGAINGTVVHSDHVGDRDFLIVDDICDGGRTFIELAKKLRPLTSGKINLYVTHSIFSQGLDVFNGVIDKIYCPNVFPNVGQSPILQRI